MQGQPYDKVASIYDHFQNGITSSSWASYIHTFVRKHGPGQGDGDSGNLLLCDLGCGTGTMCQEMRDLGYDVIGIDRSVGMLEKARENNSSGDILYLHQDITRMELFGTVDVFTCLLDTVNHLTRKADFERMLASFRNYLNPGGLFIFDVATPHHLRDTLGNHSFHTVFEDYSLFWQNRFSEKTAISTSDLILFEKEESGLYRRSDIRIRERVYENDEIIDLLSSNGLSVVGCYGDLVDRPPRKTDERIFYVAKKSSDKVE